MRLTIDDYLDRITPDPQGCKIWDGKHTKIGSRNRRSPMFRDTPSTWVSARRAVWESKTGVLLSGSDRVITTCGRDLCVSFDHLAIADMRTVVLQVQRDWKCMKGLHDMRDPSNRAPGGNGHDICRACKNVRLRAWRARRR